MRETVNTSPNEAETQGHVRRRVAPQTNADQPKISLAGFILTSARSYDTTFLSAVPEQMDQKTFSVVAVIIFAVVALLHMARIVMNWPVVIGGWSVPMWVSWIALIVAGSLAFLGSKSVARGAS